MFTQSVLLQNRAAQAFLFNALNSIEYSLNINFKMRKLRLRNVRPLIKHLALQ